MTLSAVKYVKIVVGMVAVLFVTACVNTTVMTRSETPAPQKLTSTSVEWDGSVKVKYTIGAKVRKGEEMPAAAKLQGLQVVANLMRELSQTLPVLIKKDLQAEGVELGVGSTVRLTPIKAAHTLYAGRNAYVKISIVDDQSKSEIWTATVRVNASKGEDDKLLAQKMAQTMSAELRNAGLL